MLRRIICLLCALVLTGCTLAPEETPAPAPTCPVCPTAVTCPTSAPASAPVCTALPQLTAVPTEIPTQTPVPLPTETETPTAAPTAEANVPVPTETTAPSAVPTEEQAPAPQQAGELPMPYVLQQGTPTWMPAFNHPDRGCNWMGVAGQVLDADGIPVISIVVQVEGFIGDQAISAVGLTGSATAYGQGGYEIELSAQPVDTTGQLAIQLFNLDGEPLSDPVLFDTYDSCSENLVLVNFKASGN